VYTTTVGEPTDFFSVPLPYFTYYIYTGWGLIRNRKFPISNFSKFNEFPVFRRPSIITTDCSAIRIIRVLRSGVLRLEFRGEGVIFK